LAIEVGWKQYSKSAQTVALKC